MAISFLYNVSEDISLSALKTINLKKELVRNLTFCGDNTIPHLSKETGYSIPTVTKLIGELMEENIIQDLGKIDTTGGRRPSIYGINPRAFYYLGVEVKRKSISIGLQSADNKSIKSSESIRYQLENNKESLARLCGIINTFIESSGIHRNKIVGACINLTGRVNSFDGFSYSYFYFDEQPLTAIIESQIKIRTYIENDSRAMAFGECNGGVVQNEKDILFINISWGLGMGIICDGKLYYGKSGYSGELGHIPMFDNEILCHCGKKGCLETEVSGSAIERKVKERLQSGATSFLTSVKEIDKITMDDILRAVTEHEDMLVIEILEEIAWKLGQSMAMLINIFNPELIVIGGTLSKVSDYMELPMQTAMRRHSLNLVNQDVKIKKSKLGTSAGIIGACHIVREKFFNKS
ncbi:MAG: ROK family protein [Bacteroidales bacterium]|jgi:predicted NBD/HSP70 family sugar kinase|nr:ROK family protein [Bacteroidales bacterium]